MACLDSRRFEDILGCEGCCFDLSCLFVPLAQYNRAHKPPRRPFLIIRNENISVRLICIALRLTETSSIMRNEHGRIRLSCFICKICVFCHLMFSRMSIDLVPYCNIFKTQLIVVLTLPHSIFQENSIDSWADLRRQRWASPSRAFGSVRAGGTRASFRSSQERLPVLARVLEELPEEHPYHPFLIPFRLLLLLLLLLLAHSPPATPTCLFNCLLTTRILLVICDHAVVVHLVVH